jgi:L-cysteine:1D-myo-inositol 2-amino-2-deoxy-alpha-D-glucopyranoside ligase
VLPWPAPHVPQLPGHGQALRLFDARVGRALTTGDPAHGSLTICGTASSGGADLGHVATYVAFDLVVRAWRDAGLGVTSVMHLAAADDAEPDAQVPTGVGITGEDSHAGADEQFSAFALDMTALAVIPPTAVVGTVDAEPEAVEAVERMLGAGAAYRVAAADGGSLGRGRPNRDLTCAAGILRHLYGRCDVLGGGPELREDHHDAVVSLLRVLTGVERPVQRLMHTGTVTGGPVRVAELLEQGVAPLAIRLLVLGHHYRRDWEYTRAGLDEAEARLRRWTAAVSGNGAPPVEGMLAQVRGALADDLDTPRALAAVDDWAQTSLDVGAPGGPSESDLVEGAPGVAARSVDALLGIRL